LIAAILILIYRGRNYYHAQGGQSIYRISDVQGFNQAKPLTADDIPVAITVDEIGHTPHRH
jgi:hypothetical protein